MTDYLQEYLREPFATIPDDHLDLQRMALAEVVKLSEQSVAPAAEQVEGRYKFAREKAETEYKKATETIESDFRSNNQQIQQKYQRKIDKIQHEYEAAVRKIQSQAKDKRDEIILTGDTQVNKAKLNCQYDILTAETVADAAVKQIKKERRENKDAIPVTKDHLQALVEQADSLLLRYRQTIKLNDEDLTIEGIETKEPGELFRKRLAEAKKHLKMMYNLKTPRFFAGSSPFLLLILFCSGAVADMWLLDYLKILDLPGFAVTAPLTFVVSLAVFLFIGRLLWKKSSRQLRSFYEPFRQAVAEAQWLIDQRLKLAMEQLDHRQQQVHQKRKAEIAGAHKLLDSVKAEVAKSRKATLKQIDDDLQQQRSELNARRNDARQQVEREQHERQQQLQSQHDEDMSEFRQRLKNEMADCRERYDTDRDKLESRWQKGLACVESLLKATAELGRELHIDFSDPSWQQWTVSNKSSSVIRFGQLQLDMSQLSKRIINLAPFDIDLAKQLVLPTMLGFPDRCSLLLETPRQGRQLAIDTLRSVMVRLLTSLPPGRAHFTIIDPVGLGENFAGFMHVADYEEAIIGGRIWTDPAQIQNQLNDLTGHMENVIQKYLRNEFETIEQYNRQAGELAEPYRFLVIADLPTNFSDETAKRLSSIINSGARCGVYTLIMHDSRQELPAGIDLEDLASNSVHLVFTEGQFVWQDEIYRQFPLRLDPPPDEQLLTSIMHKVGKGAKDFNRVEVPFEITAPQENSYWSLDSAEELCIPIGRTGATRLQYLRLGKGVAQHMLIAGKTGSGKSTLLHVIVTNLALWYSPDQVELYLIDFKKGVEFKTYVTNKLSHARAVAIESDREFGLSILRKLNAEMTHRGNLFRQKGVQDLTAYRQATGQYMPRNVLIVDEFQVFFSEDDKLAQDAAVLLEQLVRQGRAFGIHVLLGSQTLGGSSALPRSTIGQMAVRIALQCSETDSQLIFDDDNSAARLLTRPGEAIYNDSGGMIVGNSPFQTAWLSDSTRDKYLSRVNELSRDRIEPAEPMIVFEGNVPADIAGNRQLTDSLQQPVSAAKQKLPTAWLGEPVAIKAPTSVVFRRQSGSNLLVVGQRDSAALALMNAALISLAAQHDPASAEFVIFQGVNPDSPQTDTLKKIASLLPHQTKIIEWRDVAEVIDELANKCQQRLQGDQSDQRSIYVIVFGLQRYRMLRRNEDDFGFSLDADQKPRPDKQFSEILREGPPLGIHTLTWADTYTALDRTLDRQTIREFDNRVLFQMSAADSSNLIDTPDANQLGFHRALFYSEEQGLMEKFRPYGPISKNWLNNAVSQL